MTTRTVRERRSLFARKADGVPEPEAGEEEGPEEVTVVNEDATPPGDSDERLETVEPASEESPQGAGSKRKQGTTPTADIR